MRKGFATSFRQAVAAGMVPFSLPIILDMSVVSEQSMGIPRLLQRAEDEAALSWAVDVFVANDAVRPLPHSFLPCHGWILPEASRI